MGVRLGAVHRRKSWLFGWDGYGKAVKCRVAPEVADRVGQSLCYVKEVHLDLPDETHVQPWDGGIEPY